ncbi:SRPBCC domain-containing protein [Brevundimonas sp.]|uniref:SRPBCC domain-containing protein n=1 Tax=Brevundimonas sp. TaxID=1871086 RepID=UPI001E0B8818|nr:SRPBCC domain-containing protein [Brevundimonas sp.]MBL0948813.1 SRPBCC domain-containing protein [Brevundimonas sp.]
MDTRIEKRVGIQATPDRLWDVLVDFPGWSRWNPYETDVEGTLGFGAPFRLTESWPGPPARRVEGRLNEWQPLAQLIWVEKRGWLFSTVRYFEIEELDKGSCILATGMMFQGLRGELFMDKHRRGIREALGEICDRLKVVAEQG